MTNSVTRGYSTVLYLFLKRLGVTTKPREPGYLVRRTAGLLK
jgi:hypothetical protein